MSGPSFIPLRCLGGAGAPANMLVDLRVLGGLSGAARANVWTVIGVALNERLPPDMDARVAAFAQQHQAAPERIAAMVRAYRLLLRSAFLVAASPHDLATDLDSVGCDEAEGERLRNAVIPGFPAALALLQQEASGGAVGDHGAMLLAVDWRLDRMVASTRGDADGAFVGMLTLRCREGDKHSRITVQALPDAIKKLRDACDSMMKAAEAQAGRS